MRGSSVDVKLSASEDCYSTPTQQLHYNTHEREMQALQQRNLIKLSHSGAVCDSLIEIAGFQFAADSASAHFNRYDGFAANPEKRS